MLTSMAGKKKREPKKEMGMPRATQKASRVLNRPSAERCRRHARPDVPSEFPMFGFHRRSRPWNCLSRLCAEV